MRLPFIVVLSFVICALPFPVCASSPDDWGYRYVTSRDSGGPVFAWRDISGVGQHLEMLDDDNEGPFYIGFQSTFYDRVCDSVFVCSNGWLSFNSRSHQFHHSLIPSVKEPNCLLAPFWTDLDPSNAGSVFVYQDSSEFVASWLAVPHRRGSSPFTFQTVLLDDGSVLFQYLSMEDSVYVDSSSVGIENCEGDIGLPFSFNGTPEGAIEDSLAVRFYTVTHDVNPIVIHSPLTEEFTSVPRNPIVSIKNYGSASESPTVTCIVMDSLTHVPIYGDTVVVADLGARDTALVVFQEWIPEEGICLVQFTVTLSSNDDASLDTLGRYVRVSKHADMAHDDGTSEGWYIVSGSPISTLAITVRFQPPYAPFHVVRGKILVSNTLPFEEVYLSPDDGEGRPDLENSYEVVQGVRADAGTTWALAEFDVTVPLSDEIWLTAIWPKAAVGPLVGEDMTPPIDSCSYYTVLPPFWFQRTTGDWMMRLEIDDEVGIEERTVKEKRHAPILLCNPNPFTSTVTITAAFGANPPWLIKVYDVAGRMVMAFPHSSCSSSRVSVLWDGRDVKGKPLRAGTYFVNLSSENGQATEKLILLH
ncbi:T9SS type A sorting domain-containing protein [candidate division TA06 bacterium]|uniref:T9SS type A sorting domain-containing protein n=1 Tax=candidate division TA06 bacterium TaxID=2250710 RepID=A0A523UUU0_UNCT6|nr:MAG: T9SS type A sorting domain-containing protein [candidate division TA06 bacterium]